MPYVANLEDCKVKLARAKEHRAHIEDVAGRFFYHHSNRVRIGAKLDPDSGFHILRVENLPDFSEVQKQAAVIVGDAVHNLRSALDHLVYQLGCQQTDNKITREKTIQFLIATNAKEFADRLDKCLGDIHPQHQQITEGYQPYHGPAGRSGPYNGPYIHELELLRELSNKDKHRLLNTVLIQPGGAEFVVPSRFMNPSVPWDSSFANAGKLLQPGTEVMRRKFRALGVPKEMPEIGFAIPILALEEYRPIAPTLQRLETFVELIVNDFQK